MRVRAGDHFEQPPVRRFDHAHRATEPVGTAGPRRTGRQEPPGRGKGPRGGSVAAIAAIAAFALIAVLLRPWEGLIGSPNGEVATDAVAGVTARPAPVAASTSAPATIGPHGDVVTGPEPTTAPSAAPSTNPTTGPEAPEPILPGYQWPTTHARITNGYGAGRASSFLLNGEPFHDGIDIASFCGAPIVASHAGVVLGAGRHNEALLGWVGDLSAFRAKLDEDNSWRTQAITVVIDDGNGYRSIYAHLGVATVEKDDIVQAGEQIGWEGASGNATGCHLHYAIFDPNETDTLTLDPKVAKKTKLPPQETARIDPLLVLPPPETVDVAWGWGAR